MAHILIADNFHYLVNWKSGVGKIPAGVFQTDFLKKQGKLLIKLLLNELGQIAGRIIKMFCHRGQRHRGIVLLQILLNLYHKLILGRLGYFLCLIRLIDAGQAGKQFNQLCLDDALIKILFFKIFFDNAVNQLHKGIAAREEQKRLLLADIVKRIQKKAAHRF